MRLASLISLAGLVLVLCTCPAGAADTAPLDALHPIDWRGTPLHTVLNDLSRDLKVTCVIESSVTPETLDQRLRLQATHLTGRQALRYAACLCDLEAVIQDDTVLIAPPAKLPRLWRLAAAAPADNTAEQARLQTIEQTRASITWIDAPLSSIARDVSASFGIDVVFHPSVLSEEGLVHYEATEASLTTIRQALEEQLKTKTQIFNGALWVVPANVQLDVSSTQPSGGVQPSVSPDRRIPGVGPLDQFVILDESVSTWPSLSGRLSRAAGIACRIAPGIGGFGASWQARGTVGEILDAAKLLGRLGWRYVPAAPGGAASIEIRPPTSKTR